MRRIDGCALAVCAAIACTSSGAALGDGPAVLVRFQAGVTVTGDGDVAVAGAAAAQSLLASVGAAQPGRMVPAAEVSTRGVGGSGGLRAALGRTWRYTVPPGVDAAAVALRVSACPGVELAEADGVGGIAGVAPSDPDFDVQWNLDNTGQGGGAMDADIDAPEAWTRHTGDPWVVIAVLDTGVQADHPDLAGKVLPGWSTYDSTADTSDVNGHGTHVAGIAAASGDNGVGMSGVHWGARVLPVRVVSPDGIGMESHCAAGIVWAVDQGVDVISMSLQYYTGTQTLADAVSYAASQGVVLVASSGNHQAVVAYPAAFPECIAVGATDRSDTVWIGSNTGPELELVAPGRAVFSLWRESGYASFTGTSMSAPHVAGVAALLVSYVPSMEREEIRALLTETADDLGPAGRDEAYGFGRVNAARALEAAYPSCITDVNGDGATNAGDLVVLIGLFGSVVDPLSASDVNGDGVVNASDVSVLISSFGSTCR